MATITNWNPFGVALDITATAGTVKRISATKYTVALTVSWETYYNGASTNFGMRAVSGGVTKEISVYNGTKRSNGSATFTGTYSISGTGAATKQITVAFHNYNTDQNKTATKNITLNVAVPALPSWTISYNANGGSGAPSAQTKFQDITLTLSGTKPTRANYTFKGWATSAGGTVVYAPGASYTANAAATLYAVWELSYIKPKIYNFSVSRCNSDGTANESGECFRLKCEWETTYSDPGFTITVTGTDGEGAGQTAKLTGASGTINSVYSFIELKADTSYRVELKIYDLYDEYAIYTTLNGLTFPFDAVMTEEGVGASVGKPAEVAGLFDVALDAKFNKPVYGNVLGLNRLPAIPEGAELNDYIDTGAWAIYSNAVAATITCGGVKLGTNGSVPPARAGRFEVNSATGEGIRAAEWSYLRQRFIPYNDSNPIWERDVARGEDNVWSYYEWWRSNLSPAVSKKIYEKAAITIGFNANSTMSVASSYTKIPFDTKIISLNDRLTLSDNSVRINADIDHIKVSANILVKCGAAGTRHFRIQKISGSTTTSYAWVVVNATAGSNTDYNFTPIIIPVKEGDLIRAVYYTADTTDYIVSGNASNGRQSYLTVEEL
jgi:uncharacterized repeat protein (TIGR02543 family)